MEALRSGNLDAATRFPAGSYPPALPFRGSAAANTVVAAHAPDHEVGVRDRRAG
jgi:hypothetical protein